MDDFCPHLVSSPKARRASKRPVVRRSAIYDASHSRRGSGWSRRLRRMGRYRPPGLLRHATIDLRTANDALRFQNLLVAVEPLFVIAGHEIKPVRHVFDCRALFGRRIDPCNLARDGDSVHAAFPWRMESRLVHLRHDRSEALFPPDVMDALHVSSSDL